MVELKPCTEKDFENIAKLARVIWDKHYITIITQQQIDYMLDKMYSFNALKKQTEEGHKIYFITNQNKEVGFISVSADADKNFWLHKFYVLQDEQNSGLGTQVFKKLF